VKLFGIELRRFERATEALWLAAERPIRCAARAPSQDSDRGLWSSTMSSGPCEVRLLAPDDVALMESLLAVFGEAFDEVETYCGARPSAAYLQRLLGSNYFLALAAMKDGEVVGGIAAYDLHKFEQERSEIYIYDLAVASAHRRQGIATALILELKEIALARGAYIVFVQADVGDRPAIALYAQHGAREKVLHFDIAIKGVVDA
jgi:aminoglycoside 3-N-acetyltransferase I